MTKTEAIAAINNLVSDKKLSRQSAAYKTIIAAIETPNVIVSCGKNTGSGRFSSSKSWRSAVVFALMTAKIPFSAGNSAPRGGAAGDNISIHLDK